MMKRTFWCLWLILGSGLSAAEPEVRCYRMGWSWMERAAWTAPAPDYEIKDPFASDYLEPPEVEPFWKAVEEAGFESRFLKEAGELRDCGPLFSRWFGDEFGGKAVYDMKQGRLIVRADAAVHEDWAGIIGDDIPRQMRLQIAVFEMPFGSEKGEATFWEEPPAEAKELGALASVGVPGQGFDARTAGGELALEAEYQIDQNDDLVELRATILFQNAGKGFEVKSGWTILPGVIWVEQIGSPEGETTLMVTLKADLIHPSGVLFDEWILKEKGGAFLREERLQGMRWQQEVTIEKESGTVYREFVVPPTLLTFLSSGGDTGEAGDDPFAADPEPDLDQGGGKRSRNLPSYEGNAPELRRWRSHHLVDIRKLLMENAVEFRDEDFAVFSRHHRKVIAKLPSVQMALLEGIIGFGPLELPRHLRVTLEQWEGGETGQAAGDRLVGTLGSTTLPGQTGSIQMGSQHDLEIQAQIDQNDHLIELRSTFLAPRGKKKKPVFQTGLTLENGQPVVIHESRIDGKRRAWVIRARVIELGRELDEFLKGQGR